MELTPAELADRIEDGSWPETMPTPTERLTIAEALRSHAANEEARKLKGARGARRIQPTSYHPFLWLAQGVSQPVPLPTSPAILALKAIVEPPAPPKHEHDYEMQYVCEDCGERKAVPTPMSGSEPLASPKHEHVWDDRTWGLTRSEQGARYIRYCQDTPCPDNATETADRLVPAPGEPRADVYRPTIAPHHAGWFEWR